MLVHGYRKQLAELAYISTLALLGVSRVVPTQTATKAHRVQASAGSEAESRHLAEFSRSLLSKL